MKPKRIILVGATGSIGRQTIDVIRHFPDQFRLVGLAAQRSEAALLALAEEDWGGPRPSLACVEGRDPRIRHRGREGILAMIRETEADIVVNGASGAQGLAPSLAALESGKDLALANKESVVMGFGLLSATAARSGKRILPVDSEHAALFQLLERIGRDEVEELIITASGGAFRDRPLAELATVSPDEAAKHPNWAMGRKITIDSATMANKGLEVIEAVRLFGFAPERVKVLVHPQSLVHGLVRSSDGSLYVNASEPDMRLPILNALSWPEVLPSPFARLELAGRTLEFRHPEPERYPLLGLAYEALGAGEGATVAFNAADEVAVAAFEAGVIGYLDIARVVARCLERDYPKALSSLEEIGAADRTARAAAEAALKD